MPIIERLRNELEDFTVRCPRSAGPGHLTPLTALREDFGSAAAPVASRNFHGFISASSSTAPWLLRALKF